MRPTSVIVQFQSSSGEATGPQIEVPFGTTRDQLEEILNTLLASGDDKKPFSFYIAEAEIVDELGGAIVSQVHAGGLRLTAMTLTVWLRACFPAERVHGGRAARRVPTTGCVSGVASHTVQ